MMNMSKNDSLNADEADDDDSEDDAYDFLDGPATKAKKQRQAAAKKAPPVRKQ